MASTNLPPHDHGNARPVPTAPSFEPYAHAHDDGIDIVLPLAIVIGALIIAGSVIYGAKSISSKLGSGPAVAQAPAPAAAPAPTAAPAEPAAKVDVAMGVNPVLGNQDAKVTIIEFSDLQCPFCKRYHDQTWPEVKKAYVDTGKVKYTFRHFPLTNIHPDASKAGEAIACAREQDKFYELSDKIFANQQTMGIADIKKYAAEIGVNAKTFNECLDSGRMKAEVDKDLAEGSAVGVSGTPTFFVNGTRLVGAQPFSAFQSAIDAALNS